MNVRIHLSALKAPNWETVQKGGSFPEADTFTTEPCFASIFAGGKQSGTRVACGNNHTLSRETNRALSRETNRTLSRETNRALSRETNRALSRTPNRTLRPETIRAGTCDRFPNLY